MQVDAYPVRTIHIEQGSLLGGALLGVLPVHWYDAVGSILMSATYYRRGRPDSGC